jgi:hypothetical protein
MSTELLKFLSSKVREEIEVISDDLARGTAKDHGDYKYACGIIRGLMIANALFADLAQRMEIDDDD